MKTRLTSLALIAGMALTGALPALADAKTESFVRENANMALQSLNDPELTSAERRARFKQLMDEFTNIDLISRRVLGKYYRRFEEGEIETFNSVFREFMLATYEARLDQYRGQEIIVTGSVEKTDSPSLAVNSVVESYIDLPGENDLQVMWNVWMFEPDSAAAKEYGTDYKVVEVGLDLEGGLIWLAGQQKDEIQSILDRSNGNPKALFERLRGLTDQLNAEAASRASSSAGTSGTPSVVQAG